MKKLVGCGQNLKLLRYQMMSNGRFKNMMVMSMSLKNIELGANMNLEIKEREWSKLADVAFDTIESYKQVLKGISWISGVYKEHTAMAIKSRDDALKFAFSEILKPTLKHFPELVPDGLVGVLKMCDEQNCDYDGDELPEIAFGDYLSDYAHLIVEALVKNMDEDEAESFDIAMSWK